MMSLSLRTLDELMASGLLPIVRIGRSVRLRRETIVKFIEDNERKSVPRLPRKR